MLARRFRLKRSPLLMACFKKGKHLAKSPCLDVLALTADKPELQNAPRFTVVVSKKVSNKANKRNLLRRRLYSVIQQNVLNQHAQKLSNFSAIIVIVKPESLTLSFNDLKQEFLRCILKP